MRKEKFIVYREKCIPEVKVKPIYTTNFEQPDGYEITVKNYRGTIYYHYEKLYYSLLRKGDRSEEIRDSVQEEFFSLMKADELEKVNDYWVYRKKKTDEEFKIAKPLRLMFNKGADIYGCAT